jgi:hypothetical protein
MKREMSTPWRDVDASGGNEPSKRALQRIVGVSPSLAR